MKTILLILIVILFSFFGHAQINNNVQKDSSTFTLKPFHYYAYKYDRNNPVMFSDYAFDFRNTSRFTMYQGSPYYNRVLYDNFSHQYIFNDPLQPYSNFESAIIGGSLNYLFQLLEKKKH